MSLVAGLISLALLSGNGGEAYRDELAQLAQARLRWQVLVTPWRYRVGAQDAGWANPTDFTGWEQCTPVTTWPKEECTVWWHALVTVPDRIGPLSTNGKRLGVVFIFQDSMKVFVDGRNMGWRSGNPKRPLWLASYAVPGKDIGVSCFVRRRGGPGIITQAELKLEGQVEFEEDFANFLQRLEQAAAQMRELPAASRSTSERLFRECLMHGQAALDAGAIEEACVGLEPAREALDELESFLDKEPRVVEKDENKN